MTSWSENGKLELSLKWNNFTDNIVSCLGNSYGDQDFVDVTLACEGGSVKAHRLILSASSLYLRRVFKENPCAHPVIILKGITLFDLQALLTYMYHGEVRICEHDIPRLLEAARFLEVRGLATAQHCEKKLEEQQAERPAAHPEERNKSDMNSSELKSILLSNAEDSSCLRFERKQSRPVPRLHALLQPEIISSTVPPEQQDRENTSVTMNDNVLQDLGIKVKEEADDVSNDSIQFEMECYSESDTRLLSTTSYTDQSQPHRSPMSPKSTNQSNDERNGRNQGHKLAFYEPRPCPKCKRIYRDAATLRTHMSIMHEILPHRISCTCGALFVTKYDMYTHRKNGHK